MDRGLSIIKRPLLSEKSTQLAESLNKVSFEVSLDATKPQIRQAIQRFFNVQVADVNTSIMPGKHYRTKAGYKKSTKWKKAIVTLKEGSKIEFFKGV